MLNWNAYLKVWFGFIVVLCLFIWENDFVVDRRVVLFMAYIIGLFIGLMHGVDFVLSCLLEKKSIKFFFIDSNLIPFFIDIFLFLFSIIILNLMGDGRLYFVLLSVPCALFLLFLIFRIIKKT